MKDKKPQLHLQRIFEIRKAKKVSQQALGKVMGGIKKGTVSYIENGDIPLKAEYIYGIAKTLGVKPWELFVDRSTGDIGPLNDQEKALILELKRIPSEVERKEALMMAIKLASKFADAK